MYIRDLGFVLNTGDMMMLCFVFIFMAKSWCQVLKTLLSRYACVYVAYVCEGATTIQVFEIYSKMNTLKCRVLGAMHFRAFCKKMADYMYKSK